MASVRSFVTYDGTLSLRETLSIQLQLQQDTKSDGTGANVSEVVSHLSARPESMKDRAGNVSCQPVCSSVPLESISSHVQFGLLAR